MTKRDSLLSAITIFVAICASTWLSSTGHSQPAAESPCAGGSSSCNDDQSVCCEWWAADVCVGDHCTGTILEESFGDLQKSIEEHKKTDRKLCNFFHSADDCNETIGAPRCAGTAASAAKHIATKTTRPFETLADGAKELKEKLNESADKFDAFKTAKKIVAVWKGGSKKFAEDVRDGFEQSSSALRQYIGNLDEAMDRVSALRSTLSACMSSHNPFLELGSSDSDLPPVSSWTNTGWGYGVTIETLPYNIPKEQIEQQRTGQDGHDYLESLLQRAPVVPEVNTLSLPGSATVISSNVRGTGRIIVGEEGTLQPGDELDSGDFPTIFATGGGPVSFAEVNVESRESSDGTHVTLRATSAKGSETVELLACSGGRSVRRNRCECAAGTWNGASCGCRANEHLEAGRCKTCPSSTEWDGSSCVCEEGTHLSRGACHSCPANTVWSGTACAAPRITHAHVSQGSFTVWNGEVGKYEFGGGELRVDNQSPGHGRYVKTTTALGTLQANAPLDRGGTWLVRVYCNNDQICIRVTDADETTMRAVNAAGGGVKGNDYRFDSEAEAQGFADTINDANQ